MPPFRTVCSPFEAVYILGLLNLLFTAEMRGTDHKRESVRAI